MNVHFHVRFENESSWILRLPRVNYSIPPDDFMNHLILSEVATLKFLESTKVPSPRVFDHGLRNSPVNPLRIAYILMEEIPGKPFERYNATKANVEKVFAGLADVLMELERHPFDSIGSLSLPKSDNAQSSNFEIGPIAGDRTGTLTWLGPFESAKTYYEAWCEEHLRLIANRQLLTQFSVNAYLVFQYLKEQALQGKLDPAQAQWDTGPFYLKHTDDKGDHIMVDDEFNITGIIDWTFSRIVPKFEAFGPSLVTADMNDIYQGSSKLSQDDLVLQEELKKKGSQLAHSIANGEKLRRFIFALSTGVEMPWSEAVDLFWGIVQAFEGDPADRDWEKWKTAYLIKLQDDRRLDALLKELKEEKV
jgi:aminoglycoside phosphotransferase (APT) family kinase protein